MTISEIIAENRRKAVKRLRTTKRKQGKGAFYSHATRSYCALGHMGLAVGVDAKSGYASYEVIQGALNLTGEVTDMVWMMNDMGGKTLREIGDYLAAEWGIV